MAGTLPGPDGKARCRWCSIAPEFPAYHDKVARFTTRDVARLLKDDGIVRHRGKIEAVINNARRAQEAVAEYGSLAAFFWRYEPDAKLLAKPQTASVSAEAIAFLKHLKKLGWAFVGPTTIYAFMQAAGLINDHAEGCLIRPKADKARKSFKRPAVKRKG